MIEQLSHFSSHDDSYKKVSQKLRDYTHSPLPTRHGGQCSDGEWVKGSDDTLCAQEHTFSGQGKIGVFCDN